MESNPDNIIKTDNIIGKTEVYCHTIVNTMKVNSLKYGHEGKRTKIPNCLQKLSLIYPLCKLTENTSMDDKQVTGFRQILQFPTANDSEKDHFLDCLRVFMD
eukprot:Sdes_comp21710_c0_seq1m20289